jgi:hypothetical protein
MTNGIDDLTSAKQKQQEALDESREIARKKQHTLDRMTACMEMTGRLLAFAIQSKYGKMPDPPKSGKEEE